MLKTRIVVIGLGRLGVELIGRLPRDFALTCLSTEEDAPGILKALGREDAELIQGDASSRLVLKEARVEEADMVVITTTASEEFNLEVARLLTGDFTTRRIISVAFSEEVSGELESMGVEVEDIYGSSALGIRNIIESRTKTPHAIGLGKEEILEVEIHSHSRFANKPLEFLRPIKWRIGIIYREGNIVVPRPDTVLKPKDRVVIMGEPPVLRTVAEAMMFNYSKFPLEYGDTLVVLCTGSEPGNYLEEVGNIYSTFPFTRAYFVLSGAALSQEHQGRIEALEIKNATVRKTALSPYAALADAFSELSDSQGLVALPDVFSRFSLGVLLRRLMSTARCPAMVCRGTFPYERVAVQCAGPERGSVAAEALESALQMAEDLSNEVTALCARPSEYLSDEEALAEDDELRKAVSSAALTYKQKILIRELSGNPINAVLGVIGEYNLLIASLSGRERNIISSFFDPDVSSNIINRSTVSTLSIPPWQEYL